MAEQTILGFQVDMATLKACPGGSAGGAVRDGRSYRCRFFDRPAGLSQEEFSRFLSGRARLNERLKGIFGEDPRICLPVGAGMQESAWVEFYEDTPREEDGALSGEDWLKLVLDAAETLNHLHRHRIIHGGLSKTAIEPVRSADGRLSARLTGLEHAFFEMEGPGVFSTGETAYLSPELGARDRPVTIRSDVFSLGLLLHEALTGTLPQPDGTVPGAKEPWQVLAMGKGVQLKISEAIADPVVVALISDMLHPTAARRPGLEEISRRLKTRRLPIESKTWPGDGITINPETAARSIIGLRKHLLEQPGDQKLRGYEVMEPDGRRWFRRASGLVQMGIASVVEATEDPWQADGIEWDAPKLHTLFSCVRRGARPGLYQVTDRAGNSRSCTAAQLKMLRFALEKDKVQQEPAPLELSGEQGSLWPEEQGRCRVDFTAAAAQGLMFDGPVELCGIRGYRFTDIHGRTHFVNKTNCLQRGILVPDNDSRTTSTEVETK